MRGLTDIDILILTKGGCERSAHSGSVVRDQNMFDARDLLMREGRVIIVPCLVFNKKYYHVVPTSAGLEALKLHRMLTLGVNV